VDNSLAKYWSPSVVLVASGWLLTLGAAALAVFTTDPPGRLFAAVAAVLFAVGAAYGTRARPRLAADAAGIVARGFGASRAFPWSAVQRMRVVRTRRWGRETALLEIDVLEPSGRERLLLFGRLDLDADPEQVERALNALREPSDRPDRP
jgi:PH (Pleckstrin Homology) domain-containing protein